MTVDIEIKTEVDAVGTNKLVDAVVDAFSPATETLGLLGDLVRVARVEVAAKITWRAKQIADATGTRLEAPPLKFLVPFYEKASLEESEDLDAHERWAQLLVQASSNGGTHPYFVTLMGQIESAQARLLKRIFNGESDATERPHALDVRPFNALTHEFHLAPCQRLVERIEEEAAGSLDTLHDTFDVFLSGRGIIIVRAKWMSGGGIASANAHVRHLPALNEIDIHMLTSLGLVRLYTFETIVTSKKLDRYIDASYEIGALTDLGLKFLSCFDLDARKEIDGLRDAYVNRRSKEGPKV